MLFKPLFPCVYIFLLSVKPGFKNRILKHVGYVWIHICVRNMWCDRSHEKFQLATIPLPSLDGNVEKCLALEQSKNHDEKW